MASKSSQTLDNERVVTLDNETTVGEVGSDREIMERMGYKQELFRGFDGFMSFSFCFTAVGLLVSVSGLFGTAMATGGPVVLVWSWIIGSIATIIVGASLAEVCSTFPTAGSVYHWAGCLSDEKKCSYFVLYHWLVELLG